MREPGRLEVDPLRHVPAEEAGREEKHGALGTLRRRRAEPEVGGVVVRREKVGEAELEALWGERAKVVGVDTMSLIWGKNAYSP